MSPVSAAFELQGQRHDLQLPALRLSYLEWHAGGEPLLLLHGLADHSLVWADLAQSLGSRYHSVAPDLRGHGESDKPAQGYKCSDIIEDLEALLDRLGWSSCHVVAHSWAAKIMAIWATQTPNRFRSLVFIDPFFINRMPGFVKLSFPILYRTLSFLKLMGPFPSYEAAEELARSLPQYETWSPLQQAVLRQGLECKPDNRWGSKFVVQARDETFADVMTVAGLTRPLEIPCLFLKPEQGLNRKEWQLKPYRTYLKKLQMQTIPGNHWPFLVAPESFNQAVATFLEKQGRSI
jgi:pimeloyl-ACP methyl ester carboxylesterase